MSSSYKFTTTIPKVQRALILQGGGALGAYQAGVFKSLYEKMKSNQNNDGDDHNRLFDIIAGTSIGVINGAILVSYFLENKKWEGSAERLESFWKYLSTPTPQISEALKQWKAEYEKGNNPSLASEEAARRYYSAKEFLKSGVENVFRPNPPIMDNRFCDSQNPWLVYDNQPLRKSIEKFAKFPIATSFEKGEPRLLVVSVDAAEGTTVTFDSYEKEQGRRETEYGDPELGKPVIIKYNEGIGIKHLMASSTLPEVYTYEEIEGRKFWDGGLLSNTPIKELLEAHKKFWEKRIGSQNLENYFKKMRSNVAVIDDSYEYNKLQEQQMQRIPDLELYIVNVFDPKENDTNIGGGNIVPRDFDGVKDRHMDIQFSDAYDAKTDRLLTDYVNLIERLISLGDNDDAIKEKINKILLDEYAPRRFNTEEYKRYIDILKDTFKIVKVVQIQRKDDIDSISGKITDFTSETVNRLIQQGYEDALSK
jgi:NTE family protein